MLRIGIIGGGASGLLAAIAASRAEGVCVTVLERGKRIGKKILATGNGRCNLTNINATQEHYHGRDTNFMQGAIDAYWVKPTLEMFGELGLLWKEEADGKVYPYCDSASAVLDVLRNAVGRRGVCVICEYDVKSIKKRGGTFAVTSYDGRCETFDRVIVATGGKAAPALGSNGSGYALLKSFGHKITDLSPSLVQLKTDTELVRRLKGIKVNARVGLGNRTECGELLFTDYGLSGPVIFSLSAYAAEDDTVTIDLMPEYGRAGLRDEIRHRARYLCSEPLENLFTGMLTRRVGQAILKLVGAAPLSRLCGTLTDEECEAVANAIKRIKLKVHGTMSWNNAQTTRGGAVTGQFDPATMESRLCRGLFACGELLDIDGDCGGYNLQWAWSSGYLAGTAASANDTAKELRRKS